MTLLKLVFLVLTVIIVNHAQTEQGSYLHDSSHIQNQGYVTFLTMDSII